MATAPDHDWRSRRHVLVTDAETLAGIGAVRSLGRSGYRVIAASSDSGALGLRSRFARAACLRPACGDPELVPWLRAQIARWDIQAIVPSEAMLLALREHFDEFAPLLPYACDACTVFRGLSKFDLFEHLRAQPHPTSAHLPPVLLISEGADDPAPAQLRALGLPLFLKADAAHALRGASGVTRRCLSVDDAQRTLAALRRHFARVVIQGFTPGVGVGAFFLIRHGQVLAEFMHRRLHEVPHTGGVSSLRESWHHQAMRRDALDKLRTLGWDGVAMLEYRWDRRTDQFRLMEMNGRLWGSLHLALHAGVDFPKLLVDAHLGRPVTPIREWPAGLRCRHTFPAEVQHVWSIWKEPDFPLTIKLRKALEFVGLSLNPQVRSDLWFPGDRQLFWLNFWRFLRQSAIAPRAKARSADRATQSPLAPRTAL